ncbi:MAG: hypothetical protein V2I51_02280 [Anderseniella sp.]|jgi:hypothetical protein|nr:hypothetical protein [Anderseniella sp.]
MTDSAERPLIGTDPAGDVNVPDGLEIETEKDSLPDRTDREAASRPVAARWPDLDDPDDLDDGPVIRRMHGYAAPRMFAQQLDCGEDHLDDPLPQAHPSRASARPAEFYGYPNDGHPPATYRNEAFSVAAIREKRMRRPAGTHTPTRLGTKLTVAALASVCMISAGVALGLYGQDIGRSIEQHARLASSEVSNAVGRLMASAASSLDQGSNGTAQQASLAGSTGSPKPADAPVSAAAGAKPVPAAGRKLIYERLPVSQDDTASRGLIAPAREARAMTAEPVTDLEQLLAPPADFSALRTQID